MKNNLIKNSANLFLIAATASLINNPAKSAESQAETDIVTELIEANPTPPPANEPSNAQTEQPQVQTQSEDVTALPTLSDTQSPTQENVQSNANVSQLPTDIAPPPQANTESAAAQPQKQDAEQQIHFVDENGTVLSTEGISFPKGMSGKWYYVADDKELKSVEKNLDAAAQNPPIEQKPQEQALPQEPQNIQNPQGQPLTQPDGQSLQGANNPPSQTPPLNPKIRHSQTAPNKRQVILRCEIVGK